MACCSVESVSFKDHSNHIYTGQISLIITSSETSVDEITDDIVISMRYRPTAVTVSVNTQGPAQQTYKNSKVKQKWQESCDGWANIRRQHTDCCGMTSRFSLFRSVPVFLLVLLCCFSRVFQPLRAKAARQRTVRVQTSASRHLSTPF